MQNENWAPAYNHRTEHCTCNFVIEYILYYNRIISIYTFKALYVDEIKATIAYMEKLRR